MIDPIIQEKIAKLSPEDQKRLAKELLADHYRNDLFALTKNLVGFKDLNWRTHGELIQVLESDAKRKLVCFPRGCFKSSVTVVAYSIWKLLRNPEERILLDSELFMNSQNFLGAIKSYLESPRFTEIFGSFKTKDWGETMTIAQRKGVWVESSITCGGVGTTKVGQHYTTIIGDDYNSPNNSNTPEKCQKIIDHLKYNLSILEPTGEYVIIGTRYAEMDVIGWILRDLLDRPDLADGNLPTETSGRGLMSQSNDAKG